MTWVNYSIDLFPLLLTRFWMIHSGLDPCCKYNYFVFYILSSFPPTFQISVFFLLLFWHEILYTTEMRGQVISLLLLHDWQVLGKCQLAHAETLLNQCGLQFSKINNKNMDQSCCWPSHRGHWQQLKVQCTPLLCTRYTLAHQVL